MLLAWTSAAATHTVKNGPNSGFILKVGPTGFAAGVDVVFEKKKCRVTQRLYSQRAFFFFGHGCCSFLLVLLLFPAWNTNKGLEVGLKVEQTFGDLQRQA